MSYIIKNTSALINTRLTDTGREKLSQGNFNIAYFQVGDSEVSYNVLPNSYNQTDTMILEPSFNAQNSSGVPESNKQNVKYPFYVDGVTGNTYGIPFMDSSITPIYNRAEPRGFFTGVTTNNFTYWSAYTDSHHAVNSNYIVDMSTLTGTDKINVIYSGCNIDIARLPQVGDFITIYYDGRAKYDCGDCGTVTTTTTTIPVSPCEEFITVTFSFDNEDIIEDFNFTAPKVGELNGKSNYEYYDNEDNYVKVFWNNTTNCWVTQIAVCCFVFILTEYENCQDTQYPPSTGWSLVSGTEIIDFTVGPCEQPITTTTTTESPITTTTTLPCDTTTTTTTTFPPPPPPPADPNCAMGMFSCYAILTYRIVDICFNEITLDRPTPNYTDLLSPCFARTIIYPPNMTNLYDSTTPLNHFNTDVINFESLCNTDELDVKIWNMNIPWSEDLAGLNDLLYKGYPQFGSVQYMGTKEYLGYQSSSGQTDTDSVYYYNSFGDKIVVTPEEQKAIAVIHYTNQTIDFYYGEKFALEPLDPTVPEDTLGQARNFKICMPTLMWHKNPDCCQGQCFWVDPPGFEEIDLFQVEYIESKKNNDMNLPGIRYYHLWDNNPTQNGLPSRVGKVFPDHKIVIIDDEEIIAAMSYKSNRNWTLPAPRVALVTPNTCGPTNQSIDGVLTGSGEYMYVTYRFTNEFSFTNSLHCNYYTKIKGPDLSCLDIGSQNVSVRFGGDFSCLNYKPYNPLTTTTTTSMFTTTTTTDNFTTTTTTICPDVCDLSTGYFAEKFEIICQKVTGDERPDPTEWRIIDYTDYLSATTINGHITADGLTGTTFVITKDLYDAAPTYDLSDYIDLTTVGDTGQQLNFGDEFYFYGTLETDIQATIYEMRYKVNLGVAEFQSSSNPGWSSGNPLYITEIGLYDSNKDLMIISKMQSPVPRQGTQQFLIKYDF